MKNRLIFTILLIAIALTTISGCSSSEEIEVTSPTGSKFEVGQVWRYQTRPGEEKSTIVIVKVESDETIGNIIHVSINGLKINNPQVEGGINEHVPHMPFSEDAIENCVVELIEEGVELPSFEQGYNEWRNAAGGVFTIPVSEAIGIIELALNQ